MLNTNSVNKLVDKIISSYLSVGVQPHELAEAAFEQNYHEINIKKIHDELKVYVCFFEFEDDERADHTLLYTYNKSKVLQRVEQKVNNRKFKIQWDRHENLSNLINELCFLLSEEFPSEFINKLMNSLPEELKNQYFSNSLCCIK